MDTTENLKRYYIKEIERQLQDSKKTVPLASEVVEPEIIENTLPSKRKVEVVVFKTKRRKAISKEHGQPFTDDQSEYEMKGFKTKKLLNKLQWDVNSYGLEGFSLEEKRKLEQERAIKLGAKPKKRSYINYKVLMEERKKLEEEKGKPKPKKEKKNTIFWKESKNTKNLGHIGKYEDGVLKLTKKDIRNFKSK